MIAQEAGKYLKPCVLELGGKSPTVVRNIYLRLLMVIIKLLLNKVLDDADIEDAARNILYSSTHHGGQVFEIFISISGIF